MRRFLNRKYHVLYLMGFACITGVVTNIVEHDWIDVLWPVIAFVWVCLLYAQQNLTESWRKLAEDSIKTMSHVREQRDKAWLQ